MKFFRRFEELAAERGETPFTICKQIPCSSASVAGWKSGSEPKAPMIIKVAAFFGVTTDYVLGVSDNRDDSTVPLGVALTHDEREMLEHFRSMSPTQQLRELGRLEALSELE